MSEALIQRGHSVKAVSKYTPSQLSTFYVNALIYERTSAIQKLLDIYIGTNLSEEGFSDLQDTLKGISEANGS